MKLLAPETTVHAIHRSPLSNMGMLLAATAAASVGLVVLAAGATAAVSGIFGTQLTIAGALLALGVLGG